MSWFDLGDGTPVLACTLAGHAETMLLVLGEVAAAYAPAPWPAQDHKKPARARSLPKPDRGAVTRCDRAARLRHPDRWV